MNMILLANLYNVVNGVVHGTVFVKTESFEHDM